MLTQEGKPFPEDIQCVVLPIQGKGGIFISNIQAASNPKTLQKHSIGAVITAIRGKNLDNIIPRHIQYLYVPAVDSQQFDISYYFEQCADFIEQQRERTNVLVHCMAGVSRSVTLVIAHLIRKTGKPFEDIFLQIKSRRKIICPNSAFISQLKRYENQLKSKSTQNKSISISMSMNKENNNNLIPQKNTNLEVSKNRIDQKQYGKIQNKQQNIMKNNIKKPTYQSYEIALKQNIKRVFQNEKLRPKQRLTHEN